MKSTYVRILDDVYKVFGYEDEGWFKILAQAGEWKEFNLEHLRPLIKADAICIDAGANLGIMTLAMASLAPAGEIYAFEPDRTTFAALEKTLRHSELSNIDARPWILGREGQCVEFIETPEWRSSSHFVDNGSDRAHSLDSLALKHVDLIKIDVEGAELDVLAGASDTLKRCKPVVLLEFNSYSFTNYRKIDPRTALHEIRGLFPKVDFFRNRTGAITPLEDAEAFLEHNKANGFVDDLICRYE